MSAMREVSLSLLTCPFASILAQAMYSMSLNAIRKGINYLFSQTGVGGATKII
jgi:hypothetical protein